VITLLAFIGPKREAISLYPVSLSCAGPVPHAAIHLPSAAEEETVKIAAQKTAIKTVRSVLKTFFISFIPL
jgi:hypothetical protein